MKKALALIFAVLVIVTCFSACGNNSSTDGIKIPTESLTGVKYGSFEKFTAVDLDGNIVDESIFKGKKLTMINIWATFCRPCIGEMPYIAQLNSDYADKDFQVIGIVSDVSYMNDGYQTGLYNDALEIVEYTGANFINLLPSKSLDKIKLNEVYSVPETIFVDENGNIIGDSYVGSRSYDSWKAIVDSIMASID